ncbi:MAG: hypothetical protein L0241_22490 [Planctomycetia bacterium]|nr:hypothetical protein [Planctomycetia bacterium]
MSNFIRGSFLLALLIAAASSHGQPTDAPKVKKAPEPQLLAKGDAYFIHAVPAEKLEDKHWANPLSITYTNRSTGKMTVLASSTGTATPLGAHWIPFGEGSWTVHTIAGVRTDSERLYILVGTWNFEGGTPSMGPVVNEVSAELRVFWLADGSKIGFYPIAGFAPNMIQPDVTDAGLVKADLSGVTVLGQTFRFKGRELASRVMESPLHGEGPVYRTSGKNFAIHAIKRLPGTSVETPENAIGTTIIYVPLTEGQRGRTLIQSGNREPKGGKEAGGVPLPAVITQTRIISTAVDTERLYVLVWHGTWEQETPKRFAVNLPPTLPPSDDYRLYVFWLADGSDLGPVQLPKTFGKKVPPESVLQDHLKYASGGVTVFGVTVSYEGKKRVK